MKPIQAESEPATTRLDSNSKGAGAIRVRNERSALGWFTLVIEQDHTGIVHGMRGDRRQEKSGFFENNRSREA